MSQCTYWPPGATSCTSAEESNFKNNLKEQKHAAHRRCICNSHISKKKNSGGADYQWKKLPVDGSNCRLRIWSVLMTAWEVFSSTRSGIEPTSLVVYESLHLNPSIISIQVAMSRVSIYRDTNNCSHPHSYHQPNLVCSSCRRPTGRTYKQSKLQNSYCYSSVFSSVVEVERLYVEQIHPLLD